jgi:hypothetical protein
VDARIGISFSGPDRRHARPAHRFVGTAAPLIAVLLLLSGCTFFKLIRSSKLKVPDFSYVRCDVASVTDRSAVLEFTVAAQNPNTIGLRNVFVDYELFFEGRRFLNGSSVELTLIPGGETKIRVPAEVVYEEILRVAGPAAAQLMMGRESLPVRVDGVVRGNPTVYNEVEAGGLFHFTWKFSRTEKVPIPKEQRELARKKVSKALKKLF